MKVKFLIKNVTDMIRIGEGNTSDLYIKNAKNFDTYEEAEKFIKTLKPGYYQIDKVYVVQ